MILGAIRTLCRRWPPSACARADMSRSSLRSQHPEAAFAALPGVLRTRVGYCAGEAEQPSPDPTYRKVCNDPAYGNYAEAIQLEYDPRAISFDDVLDAFFRHHDARSAGRKRQYASIIFAHDEMQWQRAEIALDPGNHPARKGVSTSLERASVFWDAEPYHQKWILQRKRELMLALGLTDTAQLLERPATVLNAFAAGRLPAEATMDKLEEMLQQGELEPSSHGRLMALLS